MASGCRMNQCHRELSGIPKLNVLRILDIPQRLSELISDGFQVLDDALPVMLEPVGNQHRLAVGGFDEIFQGSLPWPEHQAALLGPPLRTRRVHP